MNRNSVAWLIIAILVVTGVCLGYAQHFAAPDRPVYVAPPDVVMWNGDFDSKGLFEYGWEAQNKYHRHCCVVGVHGGEMAGVWICKPDDAPVMTVHSVARSMRAVLHTDTVLLFVTCNPGHFTMGIKGVLYPDRMVWKAPGENVRIWNGVGIDSVGSVNSMKED